MCKRVRHVQGVRVCVQKVCVQMCMWQRVKQPSPEEGKGKEEGTGKVQCVWWHEGKEGGGKKGIYKVQKKKKKEEEGRRT